MFEPSSRYYALPDAVIVDEAGREVLYKTRRLLPASESMPSVRVVRVNDADRPDLVAFRALGNAQLFWRMADANDAMDPDDLVRRPGRLLRVPEVVTR